jgi:hypothetical protein
LTSRPYRWTTTASFTGPSNRPDRARALESVVQYRPGTGLAAELADTAVTAPAQAAGQSPKREPEQAAGSGPIKGEAQRARRRRRRRGRGGAASQAVAGGAAGEGTSAPGDAAGDGGEAPDEGGSEDNLPFDGGEPGPAQESAPGKGEPTDQ